MGSPLRVWVAFIYEREIKKYFSNLSNTMEEAEKVGFRGERMLQTFSTF